jgi:lysozyme
MTTEFLDADLMRDEGLCLTAYADPLTGGEPWTIGYGHTGREVHPGLRWNALQAKAALYVDIKRTQCGLTTALPWWESLSPLRQDCIVNMAFNLGVAKLLAFNTFLGFLKAGEYSKAALDLRGTLWFKQVGERAVRIVDQLAYNIHQE